MFDTHAHLNFNRFKKTLEEVIEASQKAGVKYMVVPGTDIPSSEKALEIARNHENIFAAVGIHPHHAVSLVPLEERSDDRISKEALLEGVLQNDTQGNIVAIGEIGLDQHVYEQTKYENYHIDEAFIIAQKDILVKQIQLAKKYEKSVIVHNREAKDHLLEILNIHWDSYFEGKMVFHCCEPDKDLLEFAKSHKIFIGVDGDVTYSQEKQEFIKNVPLEMLVLETDSPFLLPEPLRSQKKYPNTPANIPLISKYIANLLGRSVEEVVKITTENALSLFLHRTSSNERIRTISQP
ncbi:hypothetical protein A3D06_02490 [Candidatus Roizmanbacteria bacterium RIFCSPHIGHO2_02_FULL_40_9]|uniref:Hydrolase TatD n=1 Tax=Candidatus Roizmanbacteria bacterium RIFCSPHIGHO2_02_FULL_40_9 TaxID=1802042 RepID=A0A1F7HD70_9BACT|nr:MAG: hypothetical protein A3D06_02490 [Candidatus Roizmanbacteria bacterium RIFCSPHIGHO2_02_FULL_40_9]